MRIRLLSPGALACALWWASAALAGGEVQGIVTLEAMKPLRLDPKYRAQTKNPIAAPDQERAIVYLESMDGHYPAAGNDAAVSIGQQGYQFRPGIAAVRTGTKVAFPNRDDEFHSVFSYSRVKRFDLGRFRKDEVSPKVTFDRPGLVKIYCEIHKHMRSLLLVLDTPWFTATDTAGHFILSDIPAGEYRIKAFLPSERILESKVTVTDRKTSQVRLMR